MRAAGKREPVATFDPAREARRLEGVEAQAAKIADADKREARVKRAMARSGAALKIATDAAQKHGAALPNVQAMFKASWRVELVDVPAGEAFIEARPAYVVRFDGNAPIARLSRAARAGDRPALEAHHVAAAEKFVALYLRAIKQPKLTASYDVVGAGGSAGPARWIDVNHVSWHELRAAQSALLPVEQEIVMEVTIYETPIQALAKRARLAPMSKPARAEGAIVQGLRCGLERLSWHWGLKQT